ncbi:MAG: hypothetical protein NZ853_04040 [Leptospiraceae bacterium]|nr:hypothetical protein [Leptospiraceae bacterium]MDW7975346.1 glycerophosphodiester phosphodiesterase family protein [Leptospiraceae bacterium]
MYRAIFVILLLLIFGVGVFWFQLKSMNQEIAEKNRIPYPVVMAHRGLSFYAPEETLPAYLAAMELGKDLYLEADIQRTKDGVLICFHDKDLKRTTNIKDVFPDRVEEEIGNFTYKELMELDAGSWFNEKFPDRARSSFKNTKILTLKELAQIAKQKPILGLYLETKLAHKYPGIEKEMILLLLETGWISPEEVDLEALGNPPIQSKSQPSQSAKYAKVILQSFEIESVKQFKKYAPKVPRVFLVDEEAEKEHQGFANLIRITKELGAHLGASGYLGYPWNQYRALKEGILVHHYTINQPFQMILLHWFGSSGIFTDKAEMALEFFYPETYKEISIPKILTSLGYE